MHMYIFAYILMKFMKCTYTGVNAYNIHTYMCVHIFTYIITYKNICTHIYLLLCPYISVLCDCRAYPAPEKVFYGDI